ncbi:hypothetical protein [Sphingobacterium hungaricum]|uniref:hypothetical protein n=1 Tax=Sphingobacterium hungaricum TaxID=2082723 RepID=UPI0018CB3E14|nr:hypothetical protein [Sphingobacterium hungaricum]
MSSADTGARHFFMMGFCVFVLELQKAGESKIFIPYSYFTFITIITSITSITIT